MALRPPRPARSWSPASWLECEELLDERLGQKEVPSSIKKFFNTLLQPFSVLANWRAAMLCMCSLVWGSATSTYSVLFPDYARHNGLTPHQTSVVLMIAGVVSFITRMVCPMLGKYFIQCPSSNWGQFHKFEK